MTPPERMRALLAEPGFVVMPAVWDGLTAKLAASAGFKTAFLSGSCVAAGRLGGPDLDLLSFAEMYDSCSMVRGAAAPSMAGAVPRSVSGKLAPMATARNGVASGSGAACSARLSQPSSVALRPGVPDSM